MNTLISIRSFVDIPTEYGIGKFYSFTGFSRNEEHVAIIFNQSSLTDCVPLVRVHSECITGDVFASKRCDCGNQLKEALNLFENQAGILIYLRQEGRGIGLYNKLDAYKIQQKGIDTYEANRLLKFKDDLRDYSAAAQMLLALEVNEIKLLSNNPDKMKQLENYGITIKERISTNFFENSDNSFYLNAKRKFGGHLFKKFSTINEVSND